MGQTCFVCQNVDCQSRGSEKIMDEISKQVSERSVDAEVKPYICFGGCDFGPNVVVHPQKVWYAGVCSFRFSEKKRKRFGCFFLNVLNVHVYSFGGSGFCTRF
jgi:hypothetical protein